MDEAPTIELATTEQLISELMKRPTFVGVIVAVRADVTGAIPKPKNPVEVYGSQKLSVLMVSWMLAQATEKVIKKLAMDEKRKGDQQ